MPKDRFLDVFIFCSILRDEEPSIEKEKAYRKVVGAAFDESSILNSVTNSYGFKDNMLGLTLKAILSDYSSVVYSSFWSSNKDLFLDSLFGTPPDLMVKKYKPSEEEKELIRNIFSGCLYPFSVIRNFRYAEYKQGADPVDSLFDLFYLSPKLMKNTLQKADLGQEKAQQIIYSIFFKNLIQHQGLSRSEDYVCPSDFVNAVVSYNSISPKPSFNSYRKWFHSATEAECEDYLQKASYILNNNHFQELIYSVFFLLSKDFAVYSSVKNTGFKRLSSLLEKVRFTPELFDLEVKALETILSSNYHLPIGANHPLFEIVFYNRRTKFDEIVHSGLIKREYQNPARSVLYNFCINHGLFTEVLAKALVRETSATVIENVYDTLFFKNKNSDGIKVVQNNTTEAQYAEILSYLAETKHCSALRSFAQGAPLKYLTRIIGKDEYADRVINQRFEAGK